MDCGDVADRECLPIVLEEYQVWCSEGRYRVKECVVLTIGNEPGESIFRALEFIGFPAAVAVEVPRLCVFRRRGKWYGRTTETRELPGNPILWEDPSDLGPTAVSDCEFRSK